jgi:hypothetical protein
MAYIGRDTDKISNIEKLDVITFDGSSSYTLQKNSVNFTPNSANSLQVSIDGVVQAGNFTVSGSTIDFGVAIPSTSTNDFIFHYGTGLITTPADGTVTTGKIQDGAVTSAKLDSGVALGKVLQVVNQWYDTQTSINATAFTDTGLTASITPSSSSNKVLVCFYPSFSAADNAYCAFKLFRDSTEIGSTTNTGTGVECFSGYTFLNSMQYSTVIQPIVYLDSPSTTSSTTYKLQVSPMRSSAYQFYLNRSHTLGDDNQFRTASNTILMEIAG